MRETKDGLSPDLLGSSIDEVSQQSDIRTITRVLDEVSAALASLSTEEKEKLQESLKTEDEQNRTKWGCS